MILLDVVNEALAGDTKEFCGMCDIEAGLGQGLDHQLARQVSCASAEIVSLERKIQRLFRPAGGALKGLEKDFNIEGFGQDFKGACAKKFSVFLLEKSRAQNDGHPGILAVDKLQKIFSVKWGIW